MQPNGPPVPKLLNAPLSQRQAAGDRLLAEFNKTAKPRAISTHLCTKDDASELDRITKCLSYGRYAAEIHDSLQTLKHILRTTTAADAKLEDIAQTQGLSTIKTVGDGNCLQYAVNEAHKAQTGSYIADNDNLRLLATALARNQIRQLAPTRPQVGKVALTLQTHFS